MTIQLPKPVGPYVLVPAKVHQQQIWASLLKAMLLCCCHCSMPVCHFCCKHTIFWLLYHGSFWQLLLFIIVAVAQLFGIISIIAVICWQSKNIQGLLLDLLLLQVTGLGKSYSRMVSIKMPLHDILLLALSCPIWYQTSCKVERWFLGRGGGGREGLHDIVLQGAGPGISLHWPLHFSLTIYHSVIHIMLFYMYYCRVPTVWSKGWWPSQHYLCTIIISLFVLPILAL